MSELRTRLTIGWLHFAMWIVGARSVIINATIEGVVKIPKNSGTIVTDCYITGQGQILEV